MFEKSLQARKSKTPETGANLCEIDTFELPPDNLIFVAHYLTTEAAQEGAAEPKYAGMKMVVISAE